jgi:hypothetical protein
VSDCFKGQINEEYLDVESNWLEENEELLVESSLFNED